METTLLPFITEFFIKLGINILGVTVTEEGGDVNIRIETPDSALLIGMHGKNIEIFQHLLSRMIERKTETYIHVHLEVNDYMKLKDEKLFRFLDSKISLATTTGQSVRMPSLSPYERKKAHGYIADKKIPGLKTQSEGEGDSRALVVSYNGQPVQKTTLASPSHQAPREITLSDEGTGI